MTSQAQRLLPRSCFWGGKRDRQRPVPGEPEPAQEGSRGASQRPPAPGPAARPMLSAPRSSYRCRAHSTLLCSHPKASSLLQREAEPCPPTCPKCPIEKIIMIHVRKTGRGSFLPKATPTLHLLLLSRYPQKLGWRLRGSSLSRFIRCRHYGTQGGMVRLRPLSSHTSPCASWLRIPGRLYVKAPGKAVSLLIII